MSLSSGTGSFRSDIEGLRAVAVLLVVIYHAAPRLLPGGFIGVDVFFVISGYLITSLLMRELAATGRISVPGFYLRRAKRLLPASVLVVVLTLTGAGLFLSPIEHNTVSETGIASLFNVSNIYFITSRLD